MIFLKKQNTLVKQIIFPVVRLNNQCTCKVPVRNRISLMQVFVEALEMHCRLLFIINESLAR